MNDERLCVFTKQLRQNERSQRQKDQEELLKYQEDRKKRETELEQHREEIKSLIDKMGSASDQKSSRVKLPELKIPEIGSNLMRPFTHQNNSTISLKYNTC